jgi:hypothetical protein
LEDGVVDISPTSTDFTCIQEFSADFFGFYDGAAGKKTCLVKYKKGVQLKYFNVWGKKMPV